MSLQGRLATCRTIIALDDSLVWSEILTHERNQGNKIKQKSEHLRKLPLSKLPETFTPKWMSEGKMSH